MNAIINVLSIGAFIAVLVWLMRQSRRSLVGWHSPDGCDFVASARVSDDAGTPSKWIVVRAHLDPMERKISLLPRGARSSGVRGTFDVVGRPHDASAAGLTTRDAGFVARGSNRDVLVRVARGSLPCDLLNALVDRGDQ